MQLLIRYQLSLFFSTFIWLLALSYEKYDVKLCVCVVHSLVDLFIDFIDKNQTEGVLIVQQQYLVSRIDFIFHLRDYPCNVTHELYIFLI